MIANAYRLEKNRAHVILALRDSIVRLYQQDVLYPQGGPTSAPRAQRCASSMYEITATARNTW